MSKKVKRLAQSFCPDSYNIDLQPDKETMKLSGTVVIHGKKTGRPSKRLTFHQHGLKITAATIVYSGKKGERTITPARINHHRSFDEVRLHADELLYPGKYTVTLSFTGNITRNMEGVYPCLFKQDGKDKQLIATQFESHHAREAFPCIDEPEAKAVFTLRLTTPAHETVLSNTPAATQTKKGKLVETTFEPTPKMSTYLLAFVFGEMGYKEAKTKDGVVVRTYATPDNVQFTDFALDVAVKTLEFYNDYFAIPYPLAKCDLIALPDFASGAMENWGCITFREQCMLVDPANTSITNQQYVAMVVAHELAHQWFGNLVTMRWWTDLWLNEGFASWIEYLAVNKLFPEWDMWTQFILDEQSVALKLDALENTHAIEVAINHPDEIRSIFDAISYSKGSAVIHMLENYLGHDVFRDGLRHYLKTNAYGNTDTVDLWDALEKVAKKPVREFMHAWTSLPGFPILEATISDNKLSLRQERFVTNPAHGKFAETVWPVPLLANDPTVPSIFDTQTADFTLSDTATLKLNNHQSGLYRIAYDPKHLEHLGEQIAHNKLSALDCIGLLSDAVETAKAGKISTVTALQFLRHAANLNDYPSWDIIHGALAATKAVMNDDDLRELMKPYTRELVASQLKRLGWDRKDSESHFDRLLRPIILSMAAAADEPWVIKRCRELFDSIEHTEELAPDLRVSETSVDVKRATDIDPDLRGVVFGTVARLGNEKDFDKMLMLHNTSLHSEERNTLSAALTGFKQPELIEKALKLITTDTVRLQDAAYWIAFSFMNRYAREQTWQWLQKHWSWLEENLGSDLSFYRMPIYVARAYSDDSFIKEYSKFFEAHMQPALDRSYKQGLEMIEWQSAWKKRDLTAIKKYFA